MKKWEEKYNEIKSGKLDIRISELQAKLTAKTISKDEYKELEKNKKVKDNISKINNIIEYKSKLEKQLQDFKSEETRRKSVSDLNKEEKYLEDELKGLEASKATVERELKNSNISDAEKVNLQQKLLDIKGKINENQNKFSKNQLDISNLPKGQIKFSSLDKEDLTANMMKISSKISKCNMICGRLIEGYSWDSIDIKLEQWQDRKFTAKKGTKNILKDAVNVDKTVTIQEKEENTNKSLVEVSEFDQKHPRLAKIKNFFKDIGKTVKNYFKGEEEPMNEEIEKTENNNRNVNKDDFREYIKVVAEKGMKQADKDRLEAKRKAVQQKISENQGREPGDD